MTWNEFRGSVIAAVTVAVFGSGLWVVYTLPPELNPLRLFVLCVAVHTLWTTLSEEDPMDDEPKETPPPSDS